ncbi:hypothetical protein BHE74_00013021 [Ensete ventricosum]|nr:hypothetical protein GW17_00008938 [Ensete ventricosum]RWW78743.1 hypothetical protein BHE74_00013021 [Ensete ventricosum]
MKRHAIRSPVVWMATDGACSIKPHSGGRYKDGWEKYNWQPTDRYKSHPWGALRRWISSLTIHIRKAPTLRCRRYSHLQGYLSHRRGLVGRSSPDGGHSRDAQGDHPPHSAAHPIAEPTAPSGSPSPNKGDSIDERSTPSDTTCR